MKHEDLEPTGATVELGTASLVTQGGMGDVIEAMGLWQKAGIAEE